MTDEFVLKIVLRVYYCEDMDFRNDALYICLSIIIQWVHWIFIHEQDSEWLPK